eukprot:6206893-Pleurochrysis_carterae.AAC.1
MLECRKSTGRCGVTSDPRVAGGGPGRAAATRAEKNRVKRGSARPHFVLCGKKEREKEREKEHEREREGECGAKEARLDSVKVARQVLWMIGVGNSRKQVTRVLAAPGWGRKGEGEGERKRESEKKRSGRRQGEVRGKRAEQGV